MDFDQQLGELQRKVTQCQEGVGRRKLIIDSLAVESGQSILDLGCGGGYQVRSLALAVGSGGRIVGNDPSLKQIEAAREYCSDLDNVEFTQDSGTDLSFHDGTFDSVTSTNVLEYIIDVDSAVAEIRRVLKKGGRFCTISVLWDHHRFHGPDPTLNDQVHHVFRDHCAHQMLPLELPKMLLFVVEPNRIIFGSATDIIFRIFDDRIVISKSGEIERHRFFKTFPTVNGQRIQINALNVSHLGHLN